MKKHNSISAYMADQTPRAKKALTKLKSIVRKCAPHAEEVMSYGMPAYKYHGMLLYCAAFTNHYSLFPMRSGINKFASKLKNYKTSAGTVQFTYDKPLPENLVADIVKFRVKENLEKAELKKQRKKKGKREK